MKVADTSGAFVEGKFDSKGSGSWPLRTGGSPQSPKSHVGRYMKAGFGAPTSPAAGSSASPPTPKNISATAFKIGVGKPSYLDKSQAKYWRTIEEGSAATWKKRSFLSLDLRGTFGATLIGGQAGPGFSTPGTFKAPEAGDSHGARGEAGPENGTGKFLPTGKYWRSPVTGKSYRMPVFHPGHEIAAMGAYAHAWAEAHMPEQAIRAARTFLDDVLAQGAGAALSGKSFPDFSVPDVGVTEVF